MSNKKRVAIFIDWENVRKCIFQEAYNLLNVKVNFNDVPTVKKLIMSFLTVDEEIYRLFFYLSDPFSKKINGVDYSKTKTFELATAFIERLAVTDHVAIRKGYLAYRGLDINKKPIFEQKQVDMLLGLDIAHVSYNKLADRILLFSADTDIVPAMKKARTNGLQVIFGYCDDVQTDIHRELKEHSDFIRPIKFKSIFPSKTP